MRTVTAVFDGRVLVPDEPIDLAPGTRVRVTIEAFAEGEARGPAYSFLETARSLKIEGPADWSERLGDGGYAGSGSGES